MGKWPPSFSMGRRSQGGRGSRNNYWRSLVRLHGGRGLELWRSNPKYLQPERDCVIFFDRESGKFSTRPEGIAAVLYPSITLARQVAPSCAAEFGVSRTRHEVIVNHTGGLHQRVADRRPHKFKSAP